MTPNHVRALVLLGAASLAACEAGSPGSELPAGVGDSLYALVETVGGTSFYPPLGPEPAATGTFVDDLLPRLHVRLDATDREGEVWTLGTFDAQSTPPLVLLAAHEMYFVNVPAATYFTDPSSAYRFTVTLDPAPDDPAGLTMDLGFSDMSDHIFTVMRYVPTVPVGVKLRIESRRAPILDEITPTTLRQGAGTMLVVYGQDFEPDSVVVMGGEQLETTFVSGGELTAYLPGYLTGTIGPQEIRVATVLGGTSEPALLTVEPAIPPGTVQPDGTVFAGMTPSGHSLFVTRCDAGQTWDGAACVGERTHLCYNNCNMDGQVTLTLWEQGPGPSDVAAATDADSSVPGMQPHQAASYCANLVEGGKSDWFLPGRVEFLSVLVPNKSLLPGFVTTSAFSAPWLTHEAYYMSSWSYNEYAEVVSMADDHVYGFFRYWGAGSSGSSANLRCARWE